MPVLLLCQGDTAGKTMLREAIEARYGTTPPAIEDLQIEFKGRARIKVGPVKTWIPVEATASFVFPTHLRWDFVVKPLNLPVQRRIEAFDGTTYRTAHGNNLPNELLETKIIASARGRLWAMAAILLTPMSDYYIKISQEGENCIKAENTKLNDTVLIHLRDDRTVDYAEVECLNLETEQLQKHTLRLDERQTIVDDLMLPTQVQAYWDEEVYFDMSPIRVKMHPALPDNWFTLESVANGV